MKSDETPLTFFKHVDTRHLW